MARKKKSDKPKPLTIEESRRLKGAASMLEDVETAKAKKAAEDKLKSGEDVTAKPAKGSERVAGETDEGPSAAPKVQVKGPLVSTGKRLRQKGYRPAKNRELEKGVKAVTLKNEQPKPRKPKKRTTTKSGKRIDPKTGQVVVPKKGQAAKVDGKVVRVDSTNIDEAQRQARTTVLPTAGPEVEKAPVELPFAPVQVAEQGYARSNPEHHEALKKLVGAAFLHLDRAARTHGTDEAHTHHAAFKETHAQVSNLDHSLGEILRVAHTAVSNPDHPDSSTHLAYARQAAGARLGLGKATADARLERSQAGRAKRMERIRAEQAAKEGNQ